MAIELSTCTQWSEEYTHFSRLKRHDRNWQYEEMPMVQHCEPANEHEDQDMVRKFALPNAYQVITLNDTQVRINLGVGWWVILTIERLPSGFVSRSIELHDPEGGCYGKHSYQYPDQIGHYLEDYAEFWLFSQQDHQKVKRRRSLRFRRNFRRQTARRSA